MTAGALASLTWWVDFSDEPAPADVIVVLAGGYARPFYAADLYRDLMAPKLWLSHPAPYSADDKVRALGIRLPEEQDINREILLKRGVPAVDIHFFGKGALSTADEARRFAAAYPAKGKRILIVTSRYHARRAKMIFRPHLKGAQVRVLASPYDDSLDRWWANKFMAQNVLMEGFKTLFYLLGGRFVGAAPIR